MDETWGYIHTSQRKWRWSNSKQPRWNAETGVLEPLMAFIHLAFWNWMIFCPSTFWYVNWLIKNCWIKMHFVQQKHISETCNSSSILKVGSVNNWFHNWFYCSLLVPVFPRIRASGCRFQASYIHCKSWYGSQKKHICFQSRFPTKFGSHICPRCSDISQDLVPGELFWVPKISQLLQRWMENQWTCHQIWLVVSNIFIHWDYFLFHKKGMSSQSYWLSLHHFSRWWNCTTKQIFSNRHYQPLITIITSQ